jgi:ADP-ribosylglycohydrolase
MRLDSKQTDRAVGVLVGQATGDALGVPYEFGTRTLSGEPQMLGGGLGGIAPGQWSDDTEMALCVAQVAATGVDLRTDEAQEAIAAGFLRWYADGPPDIGIQTRQVLSQASTAGDMRADSQALHEQSARTAGNGSLMRTGPVALAHLGDTAAIVEAARRTSALTHYDPVAGDACALWCLAIDHAVRTAELDVRVGLPHVDAASWGPLLDEAEAVDPSHFASTNGWVVAALQAAWSAISHTGGLVAGLHAAVAGGGDTDTVAAIAGQLLGAAYGGSAVPADYRRRLNGWPGMRVRDLHRLAFLTVNRGHDGDDGWPTATTIRSYSGASTRTSPHPDDAGVLLGAVGAVRPGVADAVVSLCRMGRPLEGVAPGDHVELWMIDKEHANLDLPAQLLDAARTVKLLRDEGKTVLLHCVHAHTRTPTVAAAYGALVTGSTTEDALERVCAVLPSARPRRCFVEALHSLTVA